jgi:protein tyrosine phosphatase (PTP) superfamily phosphohydrolase (DUF442 family)
MSCQERCGLPSPERGPELSLFHRAFDRLYPVIRFVYERGFGHAWFSQVTPSLWVGGAPTYGRDFDEIRALGIGAVVDMRAERAAEAGYFASHGIAVRQYFVPDIAVPDPEILTDAVAWMDARIAEGRVVLVHCAKGRGRSATVAAAWLMHARGMGFDQASALLTERRELVKLQDRHREVLEAWIASVAADRPPPGGIQ